MAKRFIDTGLFDDEWFMGLSMEGKLFWIYCITKCNHAGILSLNEKLVCFQTGLKSLSTVVQELSNSVVTIKGGKYFIPKFVTFQYPKGLSSNVLPQKYVMDELKKYELWDEKSSIVKLQLSYSSPTVIDIDKDIEEGNNSNKESETFETFWDSYKYKTGKQDALKSWNKLTEPEKETCLKAISNYVASTPELRYRKHPSTYLNGKHWTDEIIPHKPKNAADDRYFVPETDWTEVERKLQVQRQKIIDEQK